MEREVNRYFITIPVLNSGNAKLLSSETNWKILEVLSDAGIEGLSAEEISRKTQEPKSSVYEILNKLASANYVKSIKGRSAWGRPPKEVKQRFGGKPTRVFFATVPWGESELAEEFAESLKTILNSMKGNMNDLRQKWYSILEKIITEYKDNPNEFFPREPIHKECGQSHEAMEFLHAVSIQMLWNLLKGEDFEELARKHHFID